MANPVSPYGASPVSNINGGPYTGRLTRYWIPSSDGNAYYIGDFVKTLANADATGVPGVVKITNGTDAIRGCLVSLEVANVPVPGNAASLVGTDLTLAQVSIPATKAKDYYVLVADDPETLFMMQGDSTATNQVAANVNKNASFTVAAPGTATFAVSASVVNSASIATTQGLNLRLIGLVQMPNNAFGANANWIVKVNQHELAGNTVGI